MPTSGSPNNQNHPRSDTGSGECQQRNRTRRVWWTGHHWSFGGRAFRSWPMRPANVLAGKQTPKRQSSIFVRVVETDGRIGRCAAPGFGRNGNEKQRGKARQMAIADNRASEMAMRRTQRFCLRIRQWREYFADSFGTMEIDLVLIESPTPDDRALMKSRTRAAD